MRFQFFKGLFRHYQLVLLASIFVICCHNTQAQNDSILNEILEYRIPSYEVISKGRLMMVDRIAKGDKQKTREVYDYVRANVDSHYLAFYAHEQLFLNYWLGNYDEILETIPVIDTIIPNEHSHYYYRHSYPIPESLDGSDPKINPQPDVLVNEIIKKLKRDKDAVAQEIDYSSLGDMEKSLLKLYLKYSLFQYDFENESLEWYGHHYNRWNSDTIVKGALNDEANLFIDSFPNSQYKNFVRRYIRFEYAKIKTGIGFEFFLGGSGLSGYLSDKFLNPANWGAAIDVCPGRAMISLRYQGGVSKLTDSIPFDGAIWKKKADARFRLPEADIGFSVVDSKRIRLTPFAGIASMSICPPSSDRDSIPDYDLVGFSGSRTIALGLSFDLKLNRRNYYYSPIPDYSYTYFRLRYAYYDPGFTRRDKAYTGQVHSITLSIGFFSKTSKRKF